MVNDEKIKNDEDRKKRIRLAKARLMRFDNSDEEFYDRPLMMDD